MLQQSRSLEQNSISEIMTIGILLSFTQISFQTPSWVQTWQIPNIRDISSEETTKLVCSSSNQTFKKW